MRLRDLKAPFIVGVIYDDDVAAAVRTVRLGVRDGADAFELNLPRLGYPRAEALAPIFEATDRPIFTSCRRAPFTDVYGPSRHRSRPMTDDERIALQLEALAQGSAGIDMELDTFDPHPAPPPGDAILAFAHRAGPPAEVTEHPAAVARQRAIIAQVHAQGRDVVMSCHTGRPLTATKALHLARLMAERGADMVKIVGVGFGLADVLELLQATVALRSVLSLPFTLMTVGPEARVGRFLGPLFGSAWAYGQVERGAFTTMPLVRELRAVFDAIGPASPTPGDG
jgi:hypothetical protein